MNPTRADFDAAMTRAGAAADELNDSVEALSVELRQLAKPKIVAMVERFAVVLEELAAEMRALRQRREP